MTNRVDILFCACGRPEFTTVAYDALVENTSNLNPMIYLYTDGDENNFLALYKHKQPPGFVAQRHYHYGGPIACTNEMLKVTGGEFIAKVDNDTIVPPGWLETCLDVMRRFSGVDLLGIEPWTPDGRVFPQWVEPALAQDPLGVCPAIGTIPRIVSHVGGIGLFRRRAFEKYGLPTPNSADGRFGFTEWQWQNPQMVKAFIDPPLLVFLLDHLPLEPWLSLSAKYEREGIQRPHRWLYDAKKHKALWEWWLRQLLRRSQEKKPERAVE